MKSKTSLNFLRMNKTIVIRLLEANKIPHDIKTYIVDEDDLSGISVAHKIGAEEEIVFKL